MTFGHCFGLFPIGMSSDVESLNFRFCSIKVIVSIFIQCLNIFEFFVGLTFIAKVGLNFTLVGVALSYGMGIFASFYMFYCAMNWKKFMRVWEQHENTFIHSPYSNHKTTKALMIKAKVIGVSIIAYSIG